MLVVLIGCHEQVLLDFHLANIAPNICLTANHCQNQKLLQCITNKPCVFLSGLLARQQCDSKWSNDCFVSHWRHLFFAGDIRRFIDTLSMLSQATLSELIGKLSISIFRNKKSRLKETSVRYGGTPGVTSEAGAATGQVHGVNHCSSLATHKKTECQLRKTYMLYIQYSTRST